MWIPLCRCSKKYCLVCIEKWSKIFSDRQKNGKSQNQCKGKREKTDSSQWEWGKTEKKHTRNRCGCGCGNRFSLKWNSMREYSTFFGSACGKRSAFLFEFKFFILFFFLTRIDSSFRLYPSSSSLDSTSLFASFDYYSKYLHCCHSIKNTIRLFLCLFFAWLGTFCSFILGSKYSECNSQLVRSVPFSECSLRLTLKCQSLSICICLKMALPFFLFDWHMFSKSIQIRGDNKSLPF